MKAAAALASCTLPIRKRGPRWRWPKPSRTPSAFRLSKSYHQMVTALKGIDLAKPAVTQAQENYRLVKARAGQGDATATELTDAETALTRAQQDQLNSIYDYLTARARLDYAMGNSNVGQ